MHGQAEEHGGEKNPEHREDAETRFSHDTRDHAEYGERHRENDPPENSDQPPIGPLNYPGDTIEHSTSLTSLTSRPPQRYAKGKG